MGSIDFWSLDVEGGELEVLRTVDFSRLQVRARGTGSPHVGAPAACDVAQLAGSACVGQPAGPGRPSLLEACWMLCKVGGSRRHRCPSFLIDYYYISSPRSQQDS